MGKIFKEIFRVTVFMLILYLFVELYRDYKKNQIQNCHKFTIGYVILVEKNTKNRGTSFEYFVESKRYARTGKIYPFELPIGKIPVLYPCSDPDFGQLMLTPEDFEEYDLPYPDSLKWILPLIESEKS